LLVCLLLAASLVGVLPWVTPVTSATPSTSELAVRTQTVSGAGIGGYYTVLYKGSNVIATQFTLARFIVNDSQTYTVNVDGYSSCTFGYWLDTGSTNSFRSFSITGNTVYTAVMNCNSSASSVTVQSANQAGSIIGGFALALSHSGKVIARGATTNTFLTTAGQTYSLQANGTVGCTFTRWSDGSTNDPLTFTASSGSTTYTAVYDCAMNTSGVTVNSINQGESPINGYFIALEQNGKVVASGFTPTVLTVTVGQKYAVQADGYGSCTFSKWSDGVSIDPRTFVAANGSNPFTAIYNCGTISPGTITVYAHRVPAYYWAPCFATTCSAGTGPGATMWFVLRNSTGGIVATGFANENGFTFTGLNASASYSVYPADCDSCHGSTHDVLFAYWGDNNSTVRPRTVVANGTSLNAWYVCTNGCAGGP
jgi:hypothetical protein